MPNEFRYLLQLNLNLENLIIPNFHRYYSNGSEWPVCAWGMGLERLAMLVLELDDIRELYQPDLERLSRMPIL